MTLENLIGRGLEHEPSRKPEIQRLLEKIATKLTDSRNQTVSLETRFDIAYEALLQIGLVALRSHHLRPNSRGGHHVIALQTLPLTIGYPREKLRLLEEFRKQRAAGLYDGSFTPSESELNELIAVVSELQSLLMSWLSRKSI
ncbi:hypothetical protein [Pelovirga terrestris]|uniref:DNA-binding protein n=1 Tax=Pelovirga terrestris TaxID=2771352 RepID=A0A8J6UHC9_9BACT|nr:hypothetical protein [Pelovirga terrestris]MBD1401263.1 hypothetical protein [Pelovirga terrestris]